MKNIQNNQIKTGVFSALGILAILSIAVVVAPIKASANNSGSVTPYGATQYPYVANTGQNYTPGGADTSDQQIRYVSVPGPTKVVTHTVYVNNPNTVNNTSASENTTNSSDTSNDSSNLASSVILGSGGFLPSGIVGWIFFAILILIIVILVRRVTGGAKRYHEEPLKHA